MKRVAVVILNWNGKHHLETFLPSVVQHSSHLADIVVVDNGSTDDSLSFLSLNFPTVKNIELGNNYGFTGGYNRAMQQIENEISIILNSDIEVTPGWIEPILALLDSDAQIVAVQPKILAYTDKTKFEYAGAAGGFIDFLAYPFCRGRLFNSMETDLGQYNDEKEIFWATGACMFIRTQAFKEIGGFDEDFFAHNEEIDLCWRLKHKGLKIYYCGHSTVYHLGGGTLHKSNPRKTLLNFRNNLTMLIKNDHSGLLFSKFVIRLILDGMAGLKFLLEGNYPDTIAVVKAHFAVYGQINTILLKRKAISASKKPLSGVYLESIVVDHYLKGKKRIDI